MSCIGRCSFRIAAKALERKTAIAISLPNSRGMAFRNPSLKPQASRLAAGVFLIADLQLALRANWFAKVGVRGARGSVAIIRETAPLSEEVL
jgi:hypothetical protein